MIEIKKIVTQKAHESCIKVLTHDHVPFELIQQFTYEFLEEVASSLSQVTRNTFIYTGNISYKDKTLNVKFSTSDNKDIISLLVTYNYNTQEKDYTFDNLNQHLEKLIVPPEPEVITIQVEPIKDVNKLLTKALEVEKKEILNKKVNQLTSILDKKEKAQEVTKIIDTLISAEKKPSNPLFDLLKKNV